MTQSIAKPKTYTFEEYLAYDDGESNRYELVDGELVPMTPANFKHSNIVNFLFKRFDREIERLGLDWIARQGDVGIRTGTRKSRLPDVCVIAGEKWRSLPADAPAILPDPPRLVVEVVSESTATADYRHKRSEYAAVEIPEYWIVDTLNAKVSVLLLVEGFYEVTEFTGSQRIVSPTFPEIELTSEQVLSA
jgi:Uma2 family endonuclease